MKLIDADLLRKNMEFICMGIMAGTESYNAPLTEIDNAPTVPLPDFKEGYKQAIIDGKTNFSRPQGECENCDFRKFSETFIDGVIDAINKNGITSVEQLSELLKGGAE